MDGYRNGNVFDPYFIQTEFETIKSEKVLAKVISGLDLQRKWGAKLNVGGPLKLDETFNLLRSKIELRPVHNTSYIEINVLADKPEEASELANKIAEAYREFRQESRKELSSSGIKALREQVEEQEKKVRKAQEELDDITENLESS